MNIIELAKRAGFYFRDAGYAPQVLHTLPMEYSQKCFERFAHLIRAAALEEAASMFEGDINYAGIRAAIRALKEKP